MSLYYVDESQGSEMWDGTGSIYSDWDKGYGEVAENKFSFGNAICTLLKKWRLKGSVMLY